MVMTIIIDFLEKEGERLKGGNWAELFFWSPCGDCPGPGLVDELALVLRLPAGQGCFPCFSRTCVLLRLPSDGEIPCNVNEVGFVSALVAIFAVSAREH